MSIIQGTLGLGQNWKEHGNKLGRNRTRILLESGKELGKNIELDPDVETVIIPGTRKEQLP